MGKILNTYLNKQPTEKIYKGEGQYLITNKRKKYLDLTGGGTSNCILGFNHPKVLHAINNQAKKISNIDYKNWIDDNRIKLLKIHNNGVIGISRNLGVENSMGECLAFLDSDDWWLPNKLEKSVIEKEIQELAGQEIDKSKEKIIIAKAKIDALNSNFYEKI